MIGRTRIPPEPDPGQGSLFELGARFPLVEPVEPRTAGQVRLDRHAQAVRGGYHPLSLTAAPGLRLHAQAAPIEPRTAGGLRCGTCRFRQLAGRHAKDYPKCAFPDPDARTWPRQSSGDGTDVRRYWPACTDYQPRQSST
jgi:hypothetical protein